MSFGISFCADPEGSDGAGDSGCIQEALIDCDPSSFCVYLHRHLVGVETAVEGEARFIGEITFQSWLDDGFPIFFCVERKSIVESLGEYRFPARKFLSKFDW